MNIKKTKTMLSKTPMNKKINVKVNDITLEQVKHFKYLGTQITENAKSPDEMKCRIHLAKANFGIMTKVVSSCKAKNHKLLYVFYININVRGGAETWTQNHLRRI